jgi:hypothetical protein
MTISPLRAELFHADGRTDMTKPAVAFRSFADPPKNDGQLCNARRIVRLRVEQLYSHRAFLVEFYVRIGIHIETCLPVQFSLNRAKIATLPEDQLWLPKFLLLPLSTKVAFVPVIAVFTIISMVTLIMSGPGSSVGIATGYGLDGREIESQWGRDFSHLSRPALGPTQPPVYNGYRVFPGGRKRPGRDADPSPPSSAEV